MPSHYDEAVFGAILAAFFALMWRGFNAIDKRFDGIDKRLDKIDATAELIQKDQREFYGITQKLEGRVDEISHRVK